MPLTKNLVGTYLDKENYILAKLKVNTSVVVLKRKLCQLWSHTVTTSLEGLLGSKLPKVFKKCVMFVIPPSSTCTGELLPDEEEKLPTGYYL